MNGLRLCRTAGSHGLILVSKTNTLDLSSPCCGCPSLNVCNEHRCLCGYLEIAAAAFLRSVAPSLPIRFSSDVSLSRPPSDARSIQNPPIRMGMRSTHQPAFSSFFSFPPSSPFPPSPSPKSRDRMRSTHQLGKKGRSQKPESHNQAAHRKKGKIASKKIFHQVCQRVRSPFKKI